MHGWDDVEIRQTGLPSALWQLSIEWLPPQSSRKFESSSMAASSSRARSRLAPRIDNAVTITEVTAAIKAATAVLNAGDCVLMLASCSSRLVLP
jgi:hypothetical protein